MRYIKLFAVAVLLTVSAMAQDTTFGTNVFSATFVGPVKTQEVGTKGGTSTNLIYLADAPLVSQAVAVRTISAPGIDVNRESLDVYAADALKGGKIQDDRQYYTLQNHIAVYVNAHYTDDGGYLTRRRSLAIILNPRTVILILQEAPDSNGDGAAANWRTFMDSLTLSEKTCWLPEGCN
jgi:hypothetical protein